MAKQKSNSPKKSTPRKTPKNGTRKPEVLASLKGLQEKIVKNIEGYAKLARELAELDARAATKLVGEIRDDGKLATVIKRVTKANPPTMPQETVAAVFRELASGIENQMHASANRVAFLGPLHSYSHLATLERFGHSADPVPVRTIASVFESVSSGQADFGVVPIENSTDGRIVDTLERLTKAEVKICGEIPFPIHHYLLGNGRRNEIKEVCSKPQAISQCREWLSNQLPNAKITAMSSTTAAAELASKNKSVAAIASYQAGVEYRLKVIAKNIEDNKDNITRFAVIGQSVADRTGDDKTSMMFELAHSPGALADAMLIFKRKGLNLTWIESFPKPGSPNEYLFFVELHGHQTDSKVRKALAALEKKTVRLEILGSYAQSTMN